MNLELWGRALEKDRIWQELGEARSILQFCREHQKFPELPGTVAKEAATSRAASPAPSQRSGAPSLAGTNVPLSPESKAER